jgi:hypothetical protein
VADAAGPVLGKGRGGFGVGWFGGRCGVACLSRGDPPAQALVRAFGVGAGSSPTSGTMFPEVRGPFPLKC